MNEPTTSRAIELDVEVVGTPEEVWRAIATGPGISSWYVPHTVEERSGGAAMASFGPEPEMQIPGRVAVWEPPHRIVFDGGEGADGLAFEWTVEARSGGTCVVRLVNSGFGSGESWDEQFDGMSEGWLLFLHNLQLHLEYFAGQTATASLPMATWTGPADTAWARLLTELGLHGEPELGTRVEMTADAPGSDTTAVTLRLGGTVVDRGAHRLALLVDTPEPGTGIVAVEGRVEQLTVSIWTYLYGEAGAAAVARDGPAWTAWLAARSEG